MNTISGWNCLIILPDKKGEEGALKNDPSLSGIILLVKPIGFRNKI
jgi:hypothetical protein